MLPAGVETSTPSETSFLIICLDPCLTDSEAACLLCLKMDIVFSPFNLNFRISHGNTPYLMECNFDFGGEGVLEHLFKKEPKYNMIKCYVESLLFRNNIFRTNNLNSGYFFK